MKQEALLYINKAEDNLKDAQLLLKNDRYDATVNRAYYAIFHCVEAFLLIENTHPKTHEGAMRKFSELYIKTNIINKQWSDIFRDTMKRRQGADYDIDSELTKELAQETYENAESFLNMTKQYFENLKEC